MSGPPSAPAPRVGRLLLGLVVCGVVLEGSVRAMLHVPAVGDRIVRASGHGTAAELDWASRHASAWWSGAPLRPSLEGSRWDPDLGWSPVPDGPETDAHGCRDGRLPRSADARRVVLLGDSFTWGFDVPVADTFGHLLEVADPEVDVHNLAVWGYGPLQMALRYERDGAPIDADLVVWVAIDEDVVRSTYRFYAYAMPWATLGPGGLEVHGRPVPPPDDVVRGVLLRPRTLDLLALAGERREDRRAASADARRPAEARRLVPAILDRWEAAVRATGAEPVLAVLPTPDGLRQRRQGRRGWERAVYTSWCAGTTARCVDLSAALDARVEDPAAIEHHGHFSAPGHAVVAELLADLVLPTPPEEALGTR